MRFPSLIRKNMQAGFVFGAPSSSLWAHIGDFA